MVDKKADILGVFLLCWFFMIPSWAVSADTADVKQETAVTGELEGFTDEFGGKDPFSDIDGSLPEPEEIQNKEDLLRIGGFLKFETEYAYNKKNEKLSKLSPVLFVETEYKLSENFRFKASGQAHYDASYDIEEKDEYKGSNLDDEKKTAELKDVYLDGKLNNIFSVRLGRQIIAWGDSDYARITDVINPRDLTRPGLIDLEDARLPVTAFRLSAFFETVSLDAVTIHEHPGSKLSGQGGDFDYYTLLRSPQISIHDKHTPDTGLEDTSFALKTTFSFNGGDICLVAANTFDDQPWLRYDGVTNGKMVFIPEYDRLKTYGVSSSIAKGSSLFKAETAFIQDRKIMRNDFLAQISSGLPVSSVSTTREKNQVSALAGIEYTGFTDLRLSFEAQMIHTLGHDAALSVRENEYITYFQATKDLLNETLELDFFWVYMDPGNGSILRFSSTYDIFDALSVEAGVVFYLSGSEASDLHPYKDQDRVFIRIKYSF